MPTQRADLTADQASTPEQVRIDVAEALTVIRQLTDYLSDAAQAEGMTRDGFTKITSAAYGLVNVVDGIRVDGPEHLRKQY